MSEQETVADVIAEMRDAANSADAWRADMAARVVMDYADRVEIAARRERDHAVEHATRHAEAVARDNCRDCVHNPNGKNYEGGNAAAMREALEAMRNLAYEVQDMNREGDVKTSMPTAWVIDIVSAALSKPPRNCDRFNTGDVKQDAQDAMKAILDEGVAGFRGIAEYLLSPVCTEQKGEDDGGK